MNKNRDKEVIKIVYCCTFEDSCVMEHLKKQDNYLLKFCNAPDALELVVSSIHPDIILIDCTENIFNSKADSEKIVETRDISDYEDIITLDDVALSESVEPLGNEIDKDAQITPGQSSPELSLMQAYLSDHISLWNTARKAQIIFIFDNSPGMDVKIRCLENGFDVIIAPFPFEELDFRIKLHANQKELSQRVSWQETNLNRAVEHIDKLKQIIFGARSEFSREKELLHNSLKQINMMSSERDILKKELHSSKIKLSQNITGMNDFLCNMVESRNESQKGHSRRVARIAEFVADKIGLDAQAVQILKDAAMLHEVGMLLIPSSILNKEPSRWSDYEKNMVMLHPSNGATYLEKCPGFEKIAKIIRYLHENSDGTGLPEGLKKRYIPLSSKILAGADLLDQIWIDHPHASVESLLEYLEEYAGSRLDPSIVNFLEKYVITVLSHQIKHDNIRLKEIAVYQLKPGMVIGTGLFTKTGTKLFSPGTTLNDDSIRMLEKYTKEYPVDETIFIKVDL